MIPHETARERRYVYRGKIINVRRDAVVFPDGKESSREIVEHRGAVAVAAVDDEGCVYMVRQFRYAFGEELLEIPAGKLETGEGTRISRRRSASCARKRALQLRPSSIWA